jgi:hypothetical protein
MQAKDFLMNGIKHMEDRARTYDKPQGERSMGATVAAFNVITGDDLTEEEGWLFMGLLKMVRSQQGEYKSDNYEDGAAYFALQGEAAARDRSQLIAEAIMPNPVTGNWPASAEDRMIPVMQNGNEGEHYIIAPSIDLTGGITEEVINIEG